MDYLLNSFSLEVSFKPAGHFQLLLGPNLKVALNVPSAVLCRFVTLSALTH